MPVNNYSIVKEPSASDVNRTAGVNVRLLRERLLLFFSLLVGLDRLELSTSPLSGVRSSHLSYRPVRRPAEPGARNWWSWSGSNRRPPECKSGALPAELQPLLMDTKSNRGRLDAAASGRQRQPEAHQTLQVENPEREQHRLNTGRSLGLERLPLTADLQKQTQFR